MIKHILIPIDGSDFSRTAIAYGIALAKRLDALLLGLHVVDVRLLQGPVFTDLSGAIAVPPYEAFVPAVESSLNTKADKILLEFKNDCKSAGVRVETKKATGLIGETIIEVGRTCCDWILLAQRGEHVHLGDGAILGSTAQAVVRSAGKPVLVTPATFQEIESMAVAYDGSAPAKKALTLAAALSAAASWPLSVVTVSNDQCLATEITQEAEETLAPFKIDSTTLILNGKEERELLRYLNEGAVELLVMGAFGHNRLRELIIGSTTSAMIRKSTIPVLLTR